MKIINIRENQNCFIARESFEDALRSLLEDVMGADDEYTRGLALRISRDAASSLFPSDAIFGLIPAASPSSGSMRRLGRTVFSTAMRSSTHSRTLPSGTSCMRGSHLNIVAGRVDGSSRFRLPWQATRRAETTGGKQSRFDCYTAGGSPFSVSRSGEIYM